MKELNKQMIEQQITECKKKLEVISNGIKMYNQEIENDRIPDKIQEAQMISFAKDGRNIQREIKRLEKLKADISKQ